MQGICDESEGIHTPRLMLDQNQVEKTHKADNVFMRKVGQQFELSDVHCELSVSQRGLDQTTYFRSSDL